MAHVELFEKIRARLAKVDPNNRKVVAVFQMKCGDLEFVVDLKDLKVYEGKAENADATVTTDLGTFAQLLKKEITMEEAKAQGKVQVEGDLELVAKATKV